MQHTDFIEPKSAGEVSDIFLDWLKMPTPRGSGANPFENTFKAINAILVATKGLVCEADKWPTVTAEEAANSLAPEDAAKDRIFNQKEINRFLSSREVSLEQFARRHGGILPILTINNPVGGYGKKLAFRVSYQQLNPESFEQNTQSDFSDGSKSRETQGANTISSQHDSANPMIAVYQEDEAPVTRSFVASWLFKSDTIGFGSWRWWVLQGHSILAICLALFFFLSAYGVIFLGNEPTLRDFLKLLIGGVAAPAYLWFGIVKPWVNFLDDRLMIAPETFVAFRDKPAQLELITAENNKKSIQLVRYKASCPVCGASVYLSDGKPDFPRRLVGRCIESPREHVFSFDRVTRMGYALREVERLHKS